MPLTFTHIQARGSYRELGRAVGEGAREQVHASVGFFRERCAVLTGGRLTFAEAEAKATAYGDFARRWLPHHMEELEGLSEGSGVPLAALLVPNCGEELLSEEPVADNAGPLAPGWSRSGDYCTAVAVSAHGRHIVGHNMDWYEIDAPNNVFFDLTTPDGTRVMGLAGAPYLLMLGMNSHGIGSVSNSVHSNDNRIGVPNTFIRRSTLSAPTVDKARTRGLLPVRARGTNHLLADTAGTIWDIETSATASVVLDRSAAGYAAHTNHYTSVETQPFEGAMHDESAVRLVNAERLLADGLARGDDPVDLVGDVLRCHEPSLQEGICGHIDPRLPAGDQVMTVGSMICDLDQRRIYVCAGPPCESPYTVFEM